MLSQSGRYVLAYDSDCGPCTRFRRLVGLLDRHKRIEFISISRAQKDGLLDSIPPETHYKSFHLLLPDGQVRSGADGVVELFAILPGRSIAYTFVKHFPGAKRIVAYAYSSLSKLHDNGSCAADSHLQQ